MTTIVADGHLHLYPCHDHAALVDGLINRLEKLASSTGEMEPGKTILAAFLTERHDCSFFRQAVSGRTAIDGFDMKPVDADCLCLVRKADGSELFMFAGRQVVSAERVEFMALTRDLEIPDGLPAAEILATIRDSHAVPVIGWAPGKWFFSRGKLVADLIEHGRPGDFLLGDSSLRPVIWPTPVLMARAARKGIGIIAGSDPLPFSGDEPVAGTYGFRMNCDAKEDALSESVRDALTTALTMIELMGRRESIPGFVSRFMKNRAVKSQVDESDGNG